MKEQQEQTPSQPNKISVEDLLRLKRTERPASEFWVGFEREFKQRQLAAAIEVERPWWRAWSRVAIYLPAGATAVVVLGMIMLRTSGPVVTSVPESVVSAPPVSPMMAVDGYAGGASDNFTEQARAAAAQGQTVDNDAGNHSAFIPVRMVKAPASATASAGQDRAGDATQVTSSMIASVLTGAEAREQPYSSITAPVTAAVDAIVVAESAPLVASLSSPISFDMRAVASEAKPQDGPDFADSQRERLMAYADPAQASGSVMDNVRAARARERATRRLDDRALSDSISRFGATGDSVTIKF